MVSVCVGCGVGVMGGGRMEWERQGFRLFKKCENTILLHSNKT